MTNMAVNNTLILLIFLIGTMVLQIYLSKRENKWLGLIMPAINVFFSIFAALGMHFYLNESLGKIVISILSVLLVYNIPTFILLVIYFACREKRKKNKEIEKMNIQDLD